jgi:hypothetical protein
MESAQVHDDCNTEKEFLHFCPVLNAVDACPAHKDVKGQCGVKRFWLPAGASFGFNMFHRDLILKFN